MPDKIPVKMINPAVIKIKNLSFTSIMIFTPNKLLIKGNKFSTRIIDRKNERIEIINASITREILNRKRDSPIIFRTAISFALSMDCKVVRLIKLMEAIIKIRNATAIAE